MLTNPSGGLLSKGIPLGATGLAQCYELTHQLRGTAEAPAGAECENPPPDNLGLAAPALVTIFQAV